MTLDPHFANRNTALTLGARALAVSPQATSHRERP
jgi:hypothetical protein